MTHAVDFHGTLAIHTKGQHPEDFDNMPPVEKMVTRVKTWLAQGDKVVIFSADAEPNNDWDGRVARGMSRWAEIHIGQALPVTAIKSRDFDDFWDDKAHGIVPNKGKRRK
jgi:hypothetical protein